MKSLWPPHHANCYVLCLICARLARNFVQTPGSAWSLSCMTAFQAWREQLVKSWSPHECKIPIGCKSDTPIIDECLKGRRWWQLLKPNIQHPIDVDHTKHRHCTSLRKSTHRLDSLTRGMADAETTGLTRHKTDPCTQDMLRKVQLPQDTATHLVQCHAYVLLLRPALLHTRWFWPGGPASFLERWLAWPGLLSSKLLGLFRTTTNGTLYCTQWQDGKNRPAGLFQL